MKRKLKASPTATKRLLKELNTINKNPINNIHVQPEEDNILNWHFVLEFKPLEDEKNKDIHKLIEKNPYLGGIYHGKLIFPIDYPFKPPGVMMFTPSGRFNIEKLLCFSNTNYHPESWNPLWSVESILKSFYAFFLDNKTTTGAIITTKETKRKLAMKSWSYNIKNKQFNELFPNLIEKYNNNKIYKIKNDEIIKKKDINNKKKKNKKNNNKNKKKNELYNIIQFFLIILFILFTIFILIFLI